MGVGGHASCCTFGTYPDTTGCSNMLLAQEYQQFTCKVFWMSLQFSSVV